MYTEEEKSRVQQAKKRRFMRVTCLLLLSGLMLIAFLTLHAHKSLTGRPKPVYAYKARPGNAALSIIAHRNGYFEDEGVLVRVFPSGPVCVEALLYGDADFGEMGDAAFAALASRHPYVWVCAHAGGAGRDRIIARNDAGIGCIADLEDKKIGIQFGTSCMAAMLRFAESNGLSLKRNEELINIKPADMVVALRSGEIQALCCSEPTPSKALAEVAAHEVATLAGCGSNFPMGIAVKREYAEDYPDVVRGVLRALLRAEEFIEERTEDAVAIQARATGEDPEIVRNAMSRHFYRVALSEESRTSLETVARFMYGEGMIERIPDIDSIVDGRYIAAVRAETCAGGPVVLPGQGQQSEPSPECDGGSE